MRKELEVGMAHLVRAPNQGEDTVPGRRPGRMGLEGEGGVAGVCKGESGVKNTAATPALIIFFLSCSQ